MAHQPRPPLQIPAEFWRRPEVRSALAGRQIGRLLLLVNALPGVTQTSIGIACDLSQAAVSRIMHGKRQPGQVEVLHRVAIGLQMPDQARALLLGLPNVTPPPAPGSAVPIAETTTVGPVAELLEARSAVAAVVPTGTPTLDRPQDGDNNRASRFRDQSGETDAVQRRDLLRLLASAGILAAAPVGDHWAGWLEVTQRTRGMDGAAVDELAALNPRLWSIYAACDYKATVYPITRAHLDVLVDALHHATSRSVHQRLCLLLGDMMQLAGEVFLDLGRYNTAAHCYAHAATVSKEAGEFDLWASALTRHAYVQLYDGQYANAVAVLDRAARIAGEGDPQLPTRFWVRSVTAQAHASLGEHEQCHQAMADAEQVSTTSHSAGHDGWLRFDGSRLAEERGACLLRLGRADVAETILTDALTGDLSMRRRGTVLTDLAEIGARHRDPDQLVHYGLQAVALAHRTSSSIVRRRLEHLRPHLAPMRATPAVRDLDDQIARLASSDIRPAASNSEDPE
jgi:tetratricopeptide (TPR) repeat protein